MVETMNCELALFDSWLNINRLKLNAKKTKYMILGHKRTECVNELKIGHKVIERESEIKYLGCVIDEELNFNKNFD